jgi:hypothetical protein
VQGPEPARPSLFGLGGKAKEGGGAEGVGERDPEQPRGGEAGSQAQTKKVPRPGPGGRPRRRLKVVGGGQQGGAAKLKDGQVAG